MFKYFYTKGSQKYCVVKSKFFKHGKELILTMVKINNQNWQLTKELVSKSIANLLRLRYHKALHHPITYNLSLLCVKKTLTKFFLMRSSCKTRSDEFFKSFTESAGRTIPCGISGSSEFARPLLFASTFTRRVSRSNFSSIRFNFDRMAANCCWELPGQQSTQQTC